MPLPLSARRPRSVAIAAVAAALLLAACSDDSDTLTVAGTVEIRESRLAPLTSGRLLRLYRDEGDSVRPGDTIAVLEQPGLSELIAQRQAQAQAAAARTAEVQAAEADSERTANDFARMRILRAEGAASPQEFERAQSQAAAAAARLQAARGALRESQAARAAVAGTIAIREQLTLVSPVRGIVLTRYAERGEAITAGMPVVSIGQVYAPWVRAFVGERFIARLRTGQDVRIRVHGYADTAFAGRIVEIAQRAEFTPRAALTERERADLVFPIRIALADSGADGRLKAGMPVDVDIPLLP
ncbi:MAG: HlyD family secretion protein [Gemmatimonadales bacterium]